MFPIIRVFGIVAGNNCAIDQWMHLVSLNFFKKQKQLSWIFQFAQFKFVLLVFGKKIKQLSATRKCTNFLKIKNNINFTI